MSEIPSGTITGNLVDDEALRQHREAITARLLAVADYGPFIVKTAVANVPGVNSSDFNPSDMSNVHSNILSVVADENGVRVEGRGEPHGQFVLWPDQIEDVQVEHPHGRHMPLQGRDMMAVSLTKRDGAVVLRWPDRVIDSGYHDRIDIEAHPDYPGIVVVRAYKADESADKEQESRIPSLEEAKAVDEHPRTFFISKAGDDFFVVTSRMGYEETTPVVVRRPRHPDNEPLSLLQIEMVDMHKATTDEELLQAHLKRYGEASWTFRPPLMPMSPFEVDAVFLYMVSD